jgi:Flp pilus assembly protein TadG
VQQGFAAPFLIVCNFITRSRVYPSVNHRREPMLRKQLEALSGTSGCERRAMQAPHHRQGGQALPLALISMLVFVVGVLVLFNTGQIVNKKVEFNNIADAAAYSAAVQQARAYNVIAYLNRAQVANEVATAQMVSLHSWMNFAISGTDHFADAVQAIGIALDLTGVGAEVGVELNEIGVQLKEVKGEMQALRNGMKGVFSGLIKVQSAQNLAYAKATKLIADGEIADIPELVQTIITQNAVTATGSTDKAASLSAISKAKLVIQATVANTSDVKVYTVPACSSPCNPNRTADADRYANVVMAARDGFSAKRDGDVLFLHKRGGTDLVSYNRWVAVDTLNAKWGLWFLSINVPFAWGGAAAVPGPTTAAFSTLDRPDPGWNSPYVADPETGTNDRGHHDPYGGALSNGNAGKIAPRQPATPSNGAAILTGYLGLHSYEDIAAGKAVVPYTQNGSPNDAEGPVFSVLVEQPMTDVRTTSNLHIGAPAGSAPVLQVALNAPDAAQNNKMTALASAQVYFDRPQKLFPRADKERELGSLFSPYWQARLVDTPTSVKLELFGADAVGL